MNGKPPIPREHGAWVMLLGPIVLGFAAERDGSILHWVLLPLAACAIFCARDAVGLILRRRAGPGTARWLAVYTGVAAIAIGPLCRNGRLLPLAEIGLAALAALGVFSMLQVLPAVKRLDRTRAGEILGASGLALTGPGACIIASGRIDLAGLFVWLAATLYFTGAVLHVKSFIEAARHRVDWSSRMRMVVTAPSTIYHGAFLALAALTLLQWGSIGFAALIAVAPAVARAFAGAARLTPTLPNFKRVGMVETLFCIWYFAWMAPVIRSLAA